MKKLLILTAAVLVFQTTPVLAESYEGGDKPHKGKMFEKKDTNGDGVISESEFLDHAKARFDEMDKNGDGSISQDEAKVMHEAKREKMKEKRDQWKEKRQERRQDRAQDAGE